jgi:hypothetical protein
MMAEYVQSINASSAVAIAARHHPEEPYKHDGDRNACHTAKD